MIFNKIQHDKLADAVIRQLELLILEGVLRTGDQLPPERELAKKLDVSRPSLRVAIKELERHGLLIARQGGGTYVADVLGSVFSEQITYLFRKHRKAAGDYLEFRRDNDMAAAGYAAARATDADREILRRIHGRMEEAYSRGDLQAAISIDVEFHISVVEAAHNLVLLHTMRNIYEMLVSGVFYDRISYYKADAPRQAILEQHQTILDAILAGDVEAARQAAAHHVTYVEDTLRKFEQEGNRNETSLRRLEKIEHGSAQ